METGCGPHGATNEMLSDTPCDPASATQRVFQPVVHDAEQCLVPSESAPHDESTPKANRRVSSKIVLKSTPGVDEKEKKSALASHLASGRKPHHSSGSAVAASAQSINKAGAPKQSEDQGRRKSANKRFLHDPSSASVRSQ